MTTQKAIKAITDFREMAHGHAVLAEALDMAIEALEKQARLEELMNMGAEIADRMFDEGNGYD